MEKQERGLCFCGCGHKTDISKRTNSKRGDIKGQPLKYIFGHFPSKDNLAFESMYEVDNKGCWIWKTKPYSSGYGMFTSRDKRISAHRYSYELHFGPIPPGYLVCHKCDVRTCVNPEHLFLGTYKDNMQDCSVKGRIDKGEDRYCSILTDAGVMEARSLFASGGFSYRILAHRFNVSSITIRRAIQGITWKHLPQHPPK